MEGRGYYWANVNKQTVLYKGEDERWWISEKVDQNDIMYGYPGWPDGEFPPLRGVQSFLCSCYII